MLEKEESNRFAIFESKVSNQEGRGASVKSNRPPTFSLSSCRSVHFVNSFRFAVNAINLFFFLAEWWGGGGETVTEAGKRMAFPPPPSIHPSVLASNCGVRHAEPDKKCAYYEGMARGNEPAETNFPIRGEFSAPQLINMTNGESESERGGDAEGLEIGKRRNSSAAHREHAAADDQMRNYFPIFSATSNLQCSSSSRDDKRCEIGTEFEFIRIPTGMV